MTEELEARRDRLSAAKRALLEQRLRGRSTAARDAIPRAPRQHALPLSFAQERLWFLDRLGLGTAYNMAQVLRITGPLDPDTLRRSLDAVVARHEVLRTAYVERDSGPMQEGPVQKIHSAAPMVVPLTDLGHMPPDEQDREVRRMAERESTAAFDLAAGQPLRMALARLADREHVLFVTLHHIAGDDWSLQLLLGELLAHLRASRTSESPEVPELAIQYADYAAWQRQTLQGDRLTEHLAGPERQLADLPALNLPHDHPRPPVQTFRGGSWVFEVPVGTATRLNGIAREHGVTMATLLLAAFQVLLARYGGQDDVVVGSPVANRPHPELESLIGLFVSTVVMWSDLSGDPTFADLLQRVHRTTLDAQHHQELPFERLVEALRPERDLSKNPLFQVLFAMQPPPLASQGLAGGPEVRGYGLEAEITRFDLELNIRALPDAIAGRFCFNTDLLEAATIERMARHFLTLLESIAANPDAHLSALRVLRRDERRRVFIDWNDTAAAYPNDVLIHELFEAAAERTADQAAVICGDTALTYGELNHRANQLAHHLRGHGVGPEVLVGVCLERGLDLIVAILGILKAGGAYVPLDPDYPAQRLAFMLADTAAPVVVTREQLAEQLPESRAIAIRLDADGPAIASEPDDNPQRQIAESADGAAYIIYTSGSTGRPKGVVITHRNASAMLYWALTVFDEVDRSGVLASTSVCFDLSVFELFVPLSRGGTVILADNAFALPTLPGRDRVRLVNTVPSAIEELLEQGGIPSSVRTVNLAGEPLVPALVDRLYGAGIERVFDLYGPSEDTTYTTCALRAKASAATIGRPIANEQVYILDPRGEPVPPGVVGELCIGGDGVSRGYHAVPAATAERYTPDPFATRPGVRMYRTGDLARFRANGDIEFLGRADHQVKLRGYRIEPGETEAVLSTHEAVRAVAVVPWHLGSGDARLVGYVVAAQDTELSIDGLRAFAVERLPHYLVPDTLIQLDTLPMTPNGKLDRKALPEPTGTRSSQVEYEPPRTPIEEELVEIWQDLLGVDRVGIHANFFELGGQSLLATRLFSRIRSRLGLELPLRTIFRAQTVASMALAVLEHMLEEDDTHPGGDTA